MEATVAKREGYTITVNPSKNRIYYTMTGFWKKPDEFPTYFQDWDIALKSVRNGFTILTDVTQLTTPHKDMQPMFDKMQKILSDAGLRKTAELFSDDVIVRMTLDHIAKSSGMKKASFNNREKAEHWLDEM